MYTLGRLPERGRRGVRTLEADLLARREHEDDLMFERGAVQVAQRQQLCGAADAVVERTARRPRACEAYELLGHGDGAPGAHAPGHSRRARGRAHVHAQRRRCVPHEPGVARHEHPRDVALRGVHQRRLPLEQRGEEAAARLQLERPVVPEARDGEADLVQMCDEHDDRDDGSLELQTRGGFFSSLFEGQPALVHTPKGDVPGVFMPRDSGLVRHTPPPLRVDVGTTSRAATMARGVSPGSTVTMAKQFVRLAGTRATGRSFDDRVGCTAQLLALRHLDRAALKHQVIFVFSTREEIGLEGAHAAAAALGKTAQRVHAIDTFVSADSPLELSNFAVAPIGQGAVARALDNSSITPPAYVDSLVRVARARGVKLQVGTTNGGNDGSMFTPYGVVDVAMGWPLRYSHSPAEVVDLRDVVSLADMIQAVAETW